MPSSSNEPSATSSDDENNNSDLISNRRVDEAQIGMPRTILSESDPLLGKNNQQHQDDNLSLDRYGELLRFWARNHFFSKLLTYPQGLSSFTYLFRAPSIPEENPSAYVNFMHAYCTGARFCISTLWPIVFTGVLITDLANYGLHSERRYGNTLADIFWGNSPNLLGFSTNMGSYLPSVESYSSGPLAFTFVPLIYGAMNGFLHLKLPNWQWNLGIAGDLFPANVSDNKLSIRDIYQLALIADTYNPRTQRLLPRHQQRPLLDNGRFAYEQLVNVAKGETNSNFIAKFFAHYQLWTLGGRYKSIPHHMIFWLFSLYSLGAEIRLLEFMIKKWIGYINYLNDYHACNNEGGLYNLIDLWGDYACTVCGDWWFTDVNDRMTMQGCLDALLETDLPSKDIINHLTGLKNRDKFSDNKFNNITEINFSKQNPDNWSVDQLEDFTKLFDKLQSLKRFDFSNVKNNQRPLDRRKIETLANFFLHVSVDEFNFRNRNIGVSELGLLRPSFNQTTGMILSGNNPNDHMLQILKGVPLQKLTSEQNNFTQWGLEQIKFLFPELRELILSGSDMTNFDLTQFWKNLTLDYLEMASCNLLDSQAPVLGETKIANIDLRHNLISNFGVTIMFSEPHYAGFIGMDLSDTLISGVAVKIITDNPGNLHTIGLGGIVFSTDELHLLCNSTQHTAIDALHFDSSFLGDVKAIIISKECHITEVDLSGNSLTDVSGTALAGSQIKRFKLNRNQFSNPTADAFAKNLKDKESLELADNLISDTTALAKAIPGSKLSTLILSNNPLNDTEINNVIEYLVDSVPSNVPCDSDLARSIRKAKPTAPINTLFLPTPINPNKDLCRWNATLSRTNMAPTQVFSGNIGTASNFSAPQITPATVLAFSMILFPSTKPNPLNIMIGLIMLYLLLDRGVKPCCRRTGAFFRQRFFPNDTKQPNYSDVETVNSDSDVANHDSVNRSH